jgi:hypothetical protein
MDKQPIKFWFMKIEDYPGFTRNEYEVAQTFEDARAKLAFKHKVSERKISLQPTPIKIGKRSMQLKQLA